MNKIKFLVLGCFFTFAVSCSQQNRYITYKVKKGESIRDIAKRLDIKTKDLLKLNPDVDKKPKVNTTIIIPNPKSKKYNFTVVDQKIETVIDKQDEVEISDVLKEDDVSIDSNLGKVERTTYEYITHTVKPKETVYGITKNYNITKDQLLEFNSNIPQLNDNILSIGQVINIGKKAVKTFVSIEEDLKNYVTHTVKPKETVYGLTRFYNISKDSLVSLNKEYPDLKENYLNIGQVLRIYRIEDKKEIKAIKLYHDSIAIDAKVNLAVLLPFKASSFDSIKAKDIFKKNLLANMVSDFYLGAEIAIDSIKSQGVDVNVAVLDTGNRGENVNAIIKNDTLSNVDVVIGPFYSNKADFVAKNTKAPVVFPHFSNNQNTFRQNNIIKAEPDLTTHTFFLSDYLKSKYTNENIFIVGDHKEKSNSQIDKLLIDLQKHDSISKVTVLKPEDGYIKKERFTDLMKPNSHNWVIIISDDVVTVADALNSMIVLPEDVTAQVFAVKKNKAFYNIDNNKLARVGLAYVTNSFRDDYSLETKTFNNKYKRLNKAYPTEYAVKGFDVTYDVLMRLVSGNRLEDTFKNGISLRLESKFDYQKSRESLTSNNGLFIVKFNKDLSLIRID